MNGNLHTHDPFKGSHTVNDRIYCNNYLSTVKTNPPNTYYRHSYSQPVDEHIQLPQRKQPYTVNQRHLYMVNLQQQQRQRSNLDIYNFENGGSTSSASYYDRIHAQYRSNTSINQPQNPTFKQSRETSPITSNSQSQQNFLTVTRSKPIQTSHQSQSRISNSTPIIDNSSSNPLRNDDDLSIDYPHHTMDSLIQRLVPTDTYIPKQSFIYPMLLCSRMHIRPSLLLNKLARLTITSITSLTRDRSVRTMNNLLFVLSE